MESEAVGWVLGKAEEAITGGVKEKGVFSPPSLSLSSLCHVTYRGDVRGMPVSSSGEGKGLERGL